MREDAQAMRVVAAGRGAGGPPAPARATRPVPRAAARSRSRVERPDQTLFNEAVLIYSNAVRRQQARPAPLRRDPGLSRAAADHARNMARLRTHSHELPVRGQRELSQRMHRQSLSYRQAAENIAMDKVYRLLGRPISMSTRGCNFTYGDTDAAGADPHLREPRRAGGGALAGLAEAPRLAAVADLPAARRRRRGRPEGPACGDFYLVQDFAD